MKILISKIEKFSGCVCKNSVLDITAFVKLGVTLSYEMKIVFCNNNWFSKVLRNCVENSPRARPNIWHSLWSVSGRQLSAKPLWTPCRKEIFLPSFIFPLWSGDEITAKFPNTCFVKILCFHNPFVVLYRNLQHGI